MKFALLLVPLALSLTACTEGAARPDAGRPVAPSDSAASGATASGTVGCGPADNPQVQGEAKNLPPLSSVDAVVVGEPGRTAPRVQAVSVDAAGRAAFVVPVRTLDPAALLVTLQDGARVLTEVSLVRQGPDVCG
jgi:hypothetical protein